MSVVEQILAGAHIQEEDLNSVTCLLVKSTDNCSFQDIRICMYKPDKDCLRGWGSSRKPFLGLKNCGAYRKLPFMLCFLFTVLLPGIPRTGGEGCVCMQGLERNLSVVLFPKISQ